MAADEDIRALISTTQTKPHEFNPSRFLRQCQSILISARVEGAELDATGPRFLELQGLYFLCADFLSENGFASAAVTLLLDWWEYTGRRQCATVDPVYRANSGYKLAQLYLHSGDRGAALRWSLLIHAADQIFNPSQEGGAGAQWLQNIFGMTDGQLSRFNEVIQSFQDEPRYPFIGRAIFPEDVLICLATERDVFEPYFSQLSLQRDFPLSQSYFELLLSEVDRNDATNDEKGRALEYLASYLFLLVPCWIPRNNLLDENEGFETDILVNNFNPFGNINAEILGRHILVECKNWKVSVGARDVGYFLFRMRITHCKFGVIFTKSGISGKDDKDERAARSLIRRAFHEDGSTCVVLDRTDLAMIATGEVTFLDLLFRKAESFRFGNPRWS